MAKPDLATGGMLTALPPELLRDLFAKARILALTADQMVFLAGDAGDGCYRIEEGLLKVSVGGSEGDERILAIFGPGSLVGELSMIDGAPRSASVYALRESKLSFVSRGDLRGLLRIQPGGLPARDDLAGTSPARHQRRVGGDKLPLLEGTRRTRAANPRSGVRSGCGGRAHSRAPEAQAKRPRGDGRHCAGKCQPNTKGLDSRSLVTRIAGYYCLENKAAIEHEAEM